MATNVPGDPAQQLQLISDVMFNPGNGELTYPQLKELVVSLRNTLQGNPAQGKLSWEQINEHVKETAQR